MNGTVPVTNGGEEKRIARYIKYKDIRKIVGILIPGTCSGVKRNKQKR